MKIVVTLSAVFLMGACTSLPQGEKQLVEMVAQDKMYSQKPEVSVDKGRPIFIKSWAYPQIYPSGDIRQGSEIYVYVGREKISFDDLLKEVSK